MLKNAASKVMGVGRVAVFLVGLAMVFALLFGVASTALGANGKPFLLGKRNAASAVSTLVKQGPGPALRLLARPGQPPMAVNSQVKVPNLNADKVDGMDASELRGPQVFTARGKNQQLDEGGNATTVARLSLPAGTYLIMAQTRLGPSFPGEGSPGEGPARVRCEVSATGTGSISEGHVQVGKEAGSVIFATLSLHGTVELEGRGDSASLVCYGRNNLRYGVTEPRITAIRVDSLDDQTQE